ncbi:MAG: MarR family transcriptional regulator [Pseudonocardia sp.]|nr:MarR family transcriptional regulator [Pseudonocardia sp.]
MNPPQTTQRTNTLITLFRDAGRAMTGELIDRLAARGYPDVRPAHSRVFENLDPAGTRVTELAERAQMTHPSMSELITGLERLGYLQRVADPADGRARMVRLTAAGRVLQRVALAEIGEIEDDWRRRLGPEIGPALRTALLDAIGERRTAAMPPG